MLRWLRLETAVLFALLLRSMLQVAMHQSTGLGITFLPVAVIVLLLTLAYFFFRMKQSAH